MNGSPHLRRHLLRRGLRVWLLVRAAFALALLMTLSPPFPTGGVVAVGVVAAAAAVAVLETRMQEEMVFLANLGERFTVLVATLALPALAAELLVALLLPVLLSGRLR